ncbi:hypothetical protein HY448_02405 [Candidatus Pacearchaeota archaeon]|nr:hypothetical protein [Candidatus Pacearchaeota archaeon]
MQRLFRLRYPKLLLLILLSIFAYFLFSNEAIQSLVKNLGELSYIGVFIAGLFFSFGFSTPFAIGFFLTASPENIFLASIIGGLGALISDLLIFKIIRFSFMDEFKKIEKTKIMREITNSLSSKPLSKIKNYLLYAAAGIVIASPLPDEIGVSMLAGLTSIRIHILAIISFIMNSVGILVILLIGKSIY